ncbi:MAG: hypothetical protein BAJALOKI1v1_1720002 [Promethearchaeota archaeon]|nr:MAG: hypothetical protein BAJALOKI1v1_1720002 [Candidatus Lokiarchaeota archaeon]
MSIELAELSEHFLFKDLTLKEIQNDERLSESIQEELADVLIYLISFANSLDIDLSSAFIKKMKKNRRKYALEEFYDGHYDKK